MRLPDMGIEIFDLLGSDACALSDFEVDCTSARSPVHGPCGVPIEGRFSGVVDIPNACATVYLPTAIFDFPVTPSAAGPGTIDPGIGAPHSSF